MDLVHDIQVTKLHNHYFRQRHSETRVAEDQGNCNVSYLDTDEKDTVTHSRCFDHKYPTNSDLLLSSV